MNSALGSSSFFVFTSFFFFVLQTMSQKGFITVPARCFCTAVSNLQLSCLCPICDPTYAVVAERRISSLV